MISAQDVRDIQFSKSLGGYKTSEVDAFLDQCADTLEQLTAEKSEADRKMQVLAETIVEYRNQEDSIRSALLSAQKMSDTVISEANEKAAAILADAQHQADNMLEDVRKNIAHEHDEWQRVRDEVAAFKAKLFAIYREHLTLIGVLEGGEAEAAPAEEKPVEAAAPAPAETKTPVEAEPFSFEAAVRQPKLDLSAFALQED